MPLCASGRAADRADEDENDQPEAHAEGNQQVERQGEHALDPDART
jgi:hypothetical protein